MKERAAYQAASAGQQTVESSGRRCRPYRGSVETDKPRSSTGSERADNGEGRVKPRRRRSG